MGKNGTNEQKNNSVEPEINNHQNLILREVKYEKKSCIYDSRP